MSSNGRTDSIAGIPITASPAACAAGVSLGSGIGVVGDGDGTGTEGLGDGTGGAVGSGAGGAVGVGVGVGRPGMFGCGAGSVLDPTEPGFTVPGPHVRLVDDVLVVVELVDDPPAAGVWPCEVCTQFDPNGDDVAGAIGTVTMTVIGPLEEPASTPLGVVGDPSGSVGVTGFVGASAGRVGDPSPNECDGTEAVHSDPGMLGETPVFARVSGAATAAGAPSASWPSTSTVLTAQTRAEINGCRPLIASGRPERAAEADVRCARRPSVSPKSRFLRPTGRPFVPLCAELPHPRVAGISLEADADHVRAEQ